MYTTQGEYIKFKKKIEHFDVMPPPTYPVGGDILLTTNIWCDDWKINNKDEENVISLNQSLYKHCYDFDQRKWTRNFTATLRDAIQKMYDDIEKKEVERLAEEESLAKIKSQEVERLAELAKRDSSRQDEAEKEALFVKQMFEKLDEAKVAEEKRKKAAQDDIDRLNAEADQNVANYKKWQDDVGYLMKI